MPTYDKEQFPIPTPWRVARELRLRRPPWWMVAALAVAVVAASIPLFMLLRARGQIGRQPRVHFFMDMDKQPRFGPQAAHPWFADGRAMRQPVEGTLARGHLRDDDAFFYGYSREAGGGIQFVSLIPDRVEVDETLIARGKQRYGIFCALCHGDAGVGNGPINQRAIELQESKWVPATNLMTQEIRDRADGQIFQAIRDGVRNMPSYRAQIHPRDTWAIVAYVRALQAASPVAAPTSAAVSSPDQP